MYTVLGMVSVVSAKVVETYIVLGMVSVATAVVVTSVVAVVSVMGTVVVEVSSDGHDRSRTSYVNPESSGPHRLGICWHSGVPLQLILRARKPLPQVVVQAIHSWGSHQQGVKVLVRIVSLPLVLLVVVVLTVLSMMPPPLPLPTSNSRSTSWPRQQLLLHARSITSPQNIMLMLLLFLRDIVLI